MTLSAVRPCRGPHWDEEEPPIVAAPLCDSCTDRVYRAVQDLPELYVAAYLALEPGQNAGERVSGGRYAPSPLNEGADALMARILFVVDTWVEVVRDAADLSAELPPLPVSTMRVRYTWQPVEERIPHPAGDVPDIRIARQERRRVVEVVPAPQDSTAGPVLSSSCRTLAAHVDTLLAQPVTTVYRVDDWLSWSGADNLVQVDMDGVDAGLELLEVHRSARAMLGKAKGRDRLAGVACPEDECQARTLYRLHGSSVVRCQTCGGSWRQEWLERWTQMLAGDVRKRKATK